MREVLFICTGNYSRSRFAEALFDVCSEAGGTALESVFTRTGDSSRRWRPVESHRIGPGRTRDRISRRPPDATRGVSLTEVDLARAHRIVALKRDERHPMMLDADRTFRFWADRITYWAVHDIDAAEPEQALAEIEILVGDLQREIDAGVTFMSAF